VDCQVVWLTVWATGQELSVARVVTEVGCGVNGQRPGLGSVLSDPDVKVIVVEHSDRLARVGVGSWRPRCGAQARRVMVADPGATTDDVVVHMIGVLTSVCARLYGRRGARNRATCALTATSGETGAA
jgi:putative resolvase